LIWSLTSAGAGRSLKYDMVRGKCPLYLSMVSVEPIVAVNSEKKAILHPVIVIAKEK